MGLDGQIIEYALCLQFIVTNNIANYESLILSLELEKEVGAQARKVFKDS